MGREASITYEQVCLAAENIESSGAKPTIRSVREKLGSGSLGTIMKFLQRRLDAQEQQNAYSDGNLDPGIIRSISGYINDKLKDINSKATVRLSDLQAEADIVIVENERLVDELGRHKQELLNWHQKYSEMSGKLMQVEAEVARISEELKSERKAVELARIELAKSELRLEVLAKASSELETTKAALSKFQTLAAEYRESAAVFAAKLEAEISGRKNLEAQMDDFRQQGQTQRK